MDLLVTTETERAIARDYVIEYGTEGDSWLIEVLERSQRYWLSRWTGVGPTWVRLTQGVPAHFIW